MFSINNLKMMEVIDVNTGSKLGYIKDFKIDCEEHKIISIMLPKEKGSWFGKSEDIEMPWKNIKKIGVDVILVECTERLEEEGE